MGEEYLHDGRPEMPPKPAYKRLMNEEEAEAPNNLTDEVTTCNTASDAEIGDRHEYAPSTNETAEAPNNFTDEVTTCNTASDAEIGDRYEYVPSTETDVDALEDVFIRHDSGSPSEDFAQCHPFDMNLHSCPPVVYTKDHSCNRHPRFNFGKSKTDKSSYEEDEARRHLQANGDSDDSDHHPGYRNYVGDVGEEDVTDDEGLKWDNGAVGYTKPKQAEEVLESDSSDYV